MKLSPLESVNDILTWHENKRPLDKYFRSSHPLKVSSLKNDVKLMVIHDMAGNYKDDAELNGSDNFNFFKIDDFDLIDIFVYFSHAILTLPPKSWINVSHRHNTKILGTLIFEFDHGHKQCEIFLKEEEEEEVTDNFINKLVDICIYFGFDGYLLNFEVNLNLDYVSKLKSFVINLNKKLKDKNHQSILIWYDAININGRNINRSCLCEENRDFFDLCDGILLDYRWSKTKLNKSKEIALTRHKDVFVGIDVFGRGTQCYPKGLNSADAIKIINDYELSSCIYAPGYFYENYKKSNWQNFNKQFWIKIRHNTKIRDFIVQLPFMTTFSKGNGKYKFKDGHVIFEGEWFNQDCQDVQLSNNAKNGVLINHDEKNKIIEFNIEDGYLDGFEFGNCIVIMAPSLNYNEICYFNMFNTNISIKDKTTINVKLIAKEIESSKIKGFVLITTDNIYTCIDNYDSNIHKQGLKNLISDDDINESNINIFDNFIKTDCNPPPLIKDFWNVFQASFINIQNVNIIQIGILCCNVNMNSKNAFECHLGKFFIEEDAENQQNIIST